MEEETTVEVLLQFIDGLLGREPHAQCREVGGPLAPVARALNNLSTQLSSDTMKAENAFGIQALVEQSPNIMFTCDTEGRVRYINFMPPGHTRTSALGTTLIDWIVPESKEMVRGVIQRVLATGEPGRYEVRSPLDTGAE